MLRDPAIAASGHLLTTSPLLLIAQAIACTGIIIVIYGPYKAEYQSWSEAIYSVSIERAGADSLD
jgi:hypothetical protein